MDDNSATGYEASPSPDTSNGNIASNEDVDPGKLDDNDADMAIDFTREQIDQAAAIGLEPQSQDDLAEIGEQIQATRSTLNDLINPDEDDNIFRGICIPRNTSAAV